MFTVPLDVIADCRGWSAWLQTRTEEAAAGMAGDVRTCARAPVRKPAAGGKRPSAVKASAAQSLLIINRNTACGVWAQALAAALAWQGEAATKDAALAARERARVVRLHIVSFSAAGLLLMGARDEGIPL